MFNCEELRDRLFDLGFETEENEEELLNAALMRAEQIIMNTCNCESVPYELRFVALDMAAGEYLLAALGKGDGENVKSISEGDMSVDFKDKSEIEEITDRLLNAGREEMLSYRRIKW